MGGFWNRTKHTTAAIAHKARGFFASADVAPPARESAGARMTAMLAEAQSLAPLSVAKNGALDDSEGCASVKSAYSLGQPHISDALLGWFLNQGFIGHQIAAFVAQHWLVAKACWMPARDAVRNGYNIVSDDGGELPPELVQKMKKADERYKLADRLVKFVGKGRVFGVQVALFKVESTDPKYYENPFNPDGVTEGSYKGIVLVDPYWCSPELDQAGAADPASLHFYEPTWWVINGQRYHRSHLVIFRNGDVPDLLKPVYLYGGVPVPQRILERVYCAERTANEAPQLAMTKRTTAYGTDAAEALANMDAFTTRLNQWVQYRDNYAVKVMDKETESIEQFDTSLTDLDAVIMSQYQIVAAAANVPATKLLGTTPKGFNATGEYEEASYHEELESLQTHDLTPLVERHHMLVMRSEIAPKQGGKVVSTSVVWQPLDSPTAKESAETQKLYAERDAALVTAGAIDHIDVRNRLRKDRDSGYHGIEEAERGDLVQPDPTVGVNQPGPVAPGEATDAVDPVRLVTNQSFVDPGIVSQKIAAGDFTVQVSPVFVDEGGNRYRIVIDGHHSLAAAEQCGVAPTLVEGDYTGSDYRIVG
jgi:phage-related protein (TIGR01555 family)